MNISFDSVEILEYKAALAKVVTLGVFIIICILILILIFIGWCIKTLCCTKPCFNDETTIGEGILDED
jgi:hypothetical protein